MKPLTAMGDEHANRAVAQVYLRKAWTELVIMVSMEPKQRKNAAKM